MNAGHDGPEAHQTAWPAVTVVVPVFNGGSCIAACIEALLGQDYPGTTPELIVVDNASTDATPMILRQYGDRIRTLRVAQRGSSPARCAPTSSMQRGARKESTPHSMMSGWRRLG